MLIMLIRFNLYFLDFTAVFHYDFCFNQNKELTNSYMLILIEVLILNKNNKLLEHVCTSLQGDINNIRSKNY